MQELSLTQPILNKKLATQYAADIINNIDVAIETRKDYIYRLGLFMQFFKKQKYTLTPNTYLEYKRFLQGQKQYSVSTKNKYLVSARIFLAEYCKNYGLPEITSNVKSFKQTRAHKVDGLHEDEVKKVSEKLATLPATPDNLRVKSIICLLALQGLRQVEVVRLDVADVNFADNTALVRGKGQDDKERIDLHPETVKVLKEYLVANKLSDGVLFFSKSNNNKDGRLTTRAIREMVKDILNQLDINRTVHGFRHYFTTKLLEACNGDLLKTAQFTRHKSLETLKVYDDRIKKQADLPKYYQAFKNIKVL